MDSILPPEMVARAFSASNGELGFLKDDAVKAAELVAASRMAILGGEVWLAGENGQWQGSVPCADGSDGVWSWVPEPAHKRDRETWDGFCRRCLAYTLNVLKTINVEETAEASYRDRIRYNLCYVSQQEYEALPSRLR